MDLEAVVVGNQSGSRLGFAGCQCKRIDCVRISFKVSKRLHLLLLLGLVRPHDLGQVRRLVDACLRAVEGPIAKRDPITLGAQGVQSLTHRLGVLSSRRGLRGSVLNVVLFPHCSAVRFSQSDIWAINRLPLMMLLLILLRIVVAMS